MNKIGLLLFAFFVMASPIFAQKVLPTILETPIKLKAKNVSIEAVLRKLTSDYNIHFSYLNNDIPLSRKVDLLAKNIPLSEVLTLVFQYTDIRFYQVSTQIVLKLEVPEKTILQDTVTKKPVAKLIRRDSLITTSIDTSHFANKNKISQGLTLSKITQTNIMIDSVETLVIYDSILTTKGDTVLHKKVLKKRKRIKGLKTPKMYPSTFNRWQTGFQFTPTLSFRTLTSSTITNAVENRNSAESSKTTYNAALYGKYFLKKWLFMGLGLHSLTYGENGAYQGYYFKAPKVRGESATRIDTNITYTNSYSYFGIPVFVGVKTKTKLYVGFTTGVSLNFLNSNQTTYPTYQSYESTLAVEPPPILPNNGPPNQAAPQQPQLPAARTIETFASETNFYYFPGMDPRKHILNKINISTSFGLDLGYHFSKKIVGELSPIFNYSLTNLYNDKSTSTLYSYGIRISLGIKF